MNENFLYAIKYLYEDTEGNILGPHQGFKYSRSKWMRISGDPMLCASGFHVPTLLDINKKYRENSWYEAYKRERPYTKKLKVFLVKLSGKFSVSKFKIAAQNIKIVSEIQYNGVTDIRKYVNELIVKYPNKTIYDINFDVFADELVYSKVLTAIKSNVDNDEEGLSPAELFEINSNVPKRKNNNERA